MSDLVSKALTYSGIDSAYCGLIGIQISQLQVRVGELGIELHRLLQQRFDLMKIEGRVLSALPLPQTHRVIIVRLCVVRLQLGESSEALDDLIGLRRRTVVGLGQKEVCSRIRGS